MYDLDYQKDTASRLVSRLLYNDSVLLTDPVGYGKTYTICRAIKQLQAAGWFDNRLWPVVWVTKSSVIKQTERVLKEFGLSNLVTVVTSYDSLRSSFGGRFISIKKSISNGVLHYDVKWSPYVLPRLFVLDECHALKNSDALQSKIFQELVQQIQDKEPDFKSKMPGPVSFIFCSATPFSTVEEARLFLTSTNRIKNTMFYRSLRDMGIYDPMKPERNYMNILRNNFGDLMLRSDESLVEASFKKIGRTLHKGIFQTVVIPSSLEVIQRYEQLYSSLLEADEDHKMVALQTYMAEMEQMKVPALSRLMHMEVQNGRAAVCAVAYKNTLERLVIDLMVSYGVSPDQISLIWGGKGKDSYFEKNLKISGFASSDRQEAIDRFQSGETRYCIYTFKAGGVGLSLHQSSPELPPRSLFVGPVYSAVELAQACGRVPRITAWSDTPIKLLVLDQTKDVDVANVVSKKLAALKEAVQAKESWYDVLVPGKIEYYSDADFDLEDADLDQNIEVI